MIDSVYDGVLIQTIHVVCMGDVVIFVVVVIELRIILGFVDVDVGTFDCVIYVLLDDSEVSGIVEIMVDSVEVVVDNVVDGVVLDVVVSL